MARCSCPACMAAHENMIGRNDSMNVVVRLTEDE